MDRRAIERIQDAFPDGAEWTVYSVIPGVQPWRVVILSEDRKREGIGTSEVSLIQAYDSAVAAWMGGK